MIPYIVAGVIAFIILSLWTGRRKGTLVECPYCNGKVSLSHEGKWACAHCGKEFTYYKGKTLKNEEFNSEVTNHLVSVLAKIANADGSLGEKELETFDQIFNDELKYNDSQKKEIDFIFHKEKEEISNYEEHLIALNNIFDGDRNILLGFLNIMFKVASANGEIQNNQEEILKRAVDIFGLSDSNYNNKVS